MANGNGWMDGSEITVIFLTFYSYCAIALKKKTKMCSIYVVSMSQIGNSYKCFPDTIYYTCLLQFIALNFHLE